MNEDTNREPDGYIYNSRRDIRTNDPIERLYSDQHDNYIAFIYSVQYKDSNGKWFKSGSRWAFNSLDTVFILENGFRDFPSISK